jgi:hypothetical protein
VRYRKKPIVVEAALYVPDDRGTPTGPWPPGWDVSKWRIAWLDGVPYLVIPTAEGVSNAAPGDIIVRGVDGEFYPVKPGIFAKSYEPAPD